MACSWEHEDRLLALGHERVAGIDEAGRGPLAGPVVAAAVMAGHRGLPAVLDDSKRLSEATREKIFEALTADPKISIGIGLASVEEIDQLNILRATFLAMRRAVEALPMAPSHLLVDGQPVQGLPLPHEALVKGDQRSFSIAAASVIAKVTRDRLMLTLHETFPAYGFSANKGYGTRAHLLAIDRHGPCAVHRRTFAPVRQLTLPF